MSKLIGYAGLIGIALVLIYVGLAVYGNYQAYAGNDYNIPSPDKARYSIQVLNTGNQLLSNDVEEVGDLITLHGYWELVGQKFKHKDTDVVLDKAVFGEITVRRRE